MSFIVDARSWTSSWAWGTGTRSLRFEALIAKGERFEFIQRHEEGYEKTTHTKRWVKKGSK